MAGKQRKVGIIVEKQLATTGGMTWKQPEKGPLSDTLTDSETAKRLIKAHGEEGETYRWVAVKGTATVTVQTVKTVKLTLPPSAPPKSDDKK